ncbi:MAG: hypothetical protein GWN84_09590 [Gammaproteobacteria bacterium]|nr:hypothetical protein [Gammaproteobacteria bacterium]NIR83124.1 hypothetical protein [Gammaproteobacteria bacterium]NIR90786.1 hypothetical protein [Gammaproteobacteria bacterium]NIU04277.1 hypothetical protein [Gammaproteobacteria bacterium]NIV51569.1 hypothetical protein [Gammaproteobacteria bacterium]
MTAALFAGALGLAGPPAFAQSGHFIKKGGNAPECTDIGTQVTCTGKVAGLGGETFEIRIAAEGLAIVECTNPGGNVAPGQATAVDLAGSTGPLPTPRNGQFVFSITTDEPEPLPPTPTCPNEMWTADIVDVIFDTATLTLFEDGVLVDTVVVIVDGF